MQLNVHEATSLVKDIKDATLPERALVILSPPLNLTVHTLLWKSAL